MRIWAGETAGRREFLEYLKDTYDRKPVLVTETRAIANAAITNYSAANNPNDDEYSAVVQPIKAATRAFIDKLPSDIVVFYSWFYPEMIDEIDYFFIHKPADAEAIIRLSSETKDRAVKEAARAREQWITLSSRAKNKLVVLGYDERVREAFTLNPDHAQGIALQLSIPFVEGHKPTEEVNAMANERQRIAKLFKG